MRKYSQLYLATKRANPQRPRLDVNHSYRSLLPRSIASDRATIEAMVSEIQTSEKHCTTEYAGDTTHLRSRMIVYRSPAPYVVEPDLESSYMLQAHSTEYRIVRMQHLSASSKDNIYCGGRANQT